MRHTVAVLAAVVLLAACSGPESGQVIAKHYAAPYMTTTSSCVWLKSGCHWITIPMYVPESWSLTLRNGEDEGAREVYRAAFERCRQGDTYPACAEVPR